MISRRGPREMPHDSLQPAEPPMTARSEDAISTKLTARAVEFIVKPGKTDELRDFLCEVVALFLRDRPGFIDTMVLTTHGAPRRVQMITFWSTERHMRYPWEETPVVREELWALIDAVSMTNAYRVDHLIQATDAPIRATLQAANRNRISMTVRQQFS